MFFPARFEYEMKKKSGAKEGENSPPCSRGWGLTVPGQGLGGDVPEGIQEKDAANASF